MKKKDVTKRLVSMLLLLVMLLGILPVNVLAEQVSALAETRKSTKAAESDEGIAGQDTQLSETIQAAARLRFYCNFTLGCRGTSSDYYYRTHSR